MLFFAHKSASTDTAQRVLFDHAGANADKNVSEDRPFWQVVGASVQLIQLLPIK